MADATSSDGDCRPGVRTLEIKETSDTSKSAEPVVEPVKAPAEEVKPPVMDNSAKPAMIPTAELQLPTYLPELKAGEKATIAVRVKSSSAFRSAVLGLRFNDKKLAIRSVTFGEIFGTTAANTAVLPFLNQNGKMFVSLSLPEGNVAAESGVLALVEVEALVDGKVEIKLEKDVLNLLAADGRNFAVKL